MKRSAIRLALLLTAVLSLWGASQLLKQRVLHERSRWPAMEELQLMPSPAVVKKLALGYDQAVADLWWARTTVYYGSDTEHEASKFQYLEPLIDTVLALDPKFERVYDWASYAVTFRSGAATTDEFLRSVQYLERAIDEFPDTYKFYWLAGIRYFLDLRVEDEALQRRYRERGAELIEKAMRQPDAPSTLASYAASFRSELGQQQQALRTLEEMILLTEDPKAQAKLVARYQQIAQKEFPAEAQEAKQAFEAAWQEHLPYAPPSLFAILGEPPKDYIDWQELMAPRELFTATLEDEPSDASDSDLNDALAPTSTAPAD